MPEMQPREDYLLKLDILQDEVRKQTQSFLDVAERARQKYAGDTYQRLLHEYAIKEEMERMFLAMGKLREDYVEFGSFTLGVGTRKN